MKCTTCGIEIAENTELCPNCGRPQRRPAPKKKSSVLLGVVGALVGLILGSAVYILLSQLGIYAPIGGAVLALFTLGGFALLGRRIGGFGGVFCALILLIAPAAVDFVDWSVVLMRQSPEYALPAAVQAIPGLIADGSIGLMEYAGNLSMVYGFVLGSAVLFTIVRVITNIVKAKKER